jgi:hypothetical protein
MMVGEAKKEILEEIKRKYSINIPYERSVWPCELMAFCKRKHRNNLIWFQLQFHSDIAVYFVKEGFVMQP